MLYSQQPNLTFGTVQSEDFSSVRAFSISCKSVPVPFQKIQFTNSFSPNTFHIHHKKSSFAWTIVQLWLQAILGLLLHTICPISSSITKHHWHTNLREPTNPYPYIHIYPWIHENFDGAHRCSHFCLENPWLFPSTTENKTGGILCQTGYSKCVIPRPKWIDQFLSENIYLLRLSVFQSICIQDTFNCCFSILLVQDSKIHFQWVRLSLGLRTKSPIPVPTTRPLQTPRAPTNVAPSLKIPDS